MGSVNIFLQFKAIQFLLQRNRLPIGRRNQMLALPIFTCSHPHTIVGTHELNFCVRNGNRWTLMAINTNYSRLYPENWTPYLCYALWKALEPAILCRTSPRLISIGQLNTSRCVHLRPINDIVYVEPYSLKDERSYLRGSFTLRCFQRLSRPYVATQLCSWQNNWCTRGTSIPVLSY